MHFEHSERARTLLAQVETFMAEQVLPNEHLYDQQARAQTVPATPAIVQQLKAQARAQGLWNLFLPGAHGAGLSNLDYAPLAEAMGRVLWASEVFNCSAPDTGNMEVLTLYGTPAQQARWLKPLLAGEIRSAFSMTEPAVASSDATNIRCSITQDGDHWVVNGRKWFTSGAINSDCKLLIVMGKSSPDHPDSHRQQSMLLVPKDTPGITILRDMTVFGYDSRPVGHAEVVYDNVRVPLDHMLLGEGRGFEIAQGRLGPGRIHHCMRLIGMAERALERMCRRTSQRVAFGKPVSEQGVTVERVAECRIAIEQARLLTLHAAHRMDTVGNKVAKAEIAMIKVAVPAMACKVVDWAIQAHGGGGTSNDFGLAHAYAMARALRLADGPDEVHRQQLGRMELKKYR